MREVSGKEGVREVGCPGTGARPPQVLSALSLQGTTSRSLKVRTKKKTVSSDMNS